MDEKEREIRRVLEEITTTNESDETVQLMISDKNCAQRKKSYFGVQPKKKPTNERKHPRHRFFGYNSATGEKFLLKKRFQNKKH